MSVGSQKRQSNTAPNLLWIDASNPHSRDSTGVFQSIMLLRRHREIRVQLYHIIGHCAHGALGSNHLHPHMWNQIYYRKFEQLSLIGCVLSHCVLCIVVARLSIKRLHAYLIRHASPEVLNDKTSSSAIRHHSIGGLWSYKL